MSSIEPHSLSIRVDSPAGSDTCPIERRVASIVIHQTTLVQQASTMTTCTANNHFESLPHELLLHIFSGITDFASEPPSITKFPLKPSSKLTENPHRPIKILSLVCRSWRFILLPELFKYSRVSLDCRPQWLYCSADVAKCIRTRSVRSPRAKEILEFIECASPNALDENASDGQISLKYIASSETSLLSLPPEHFRWVPSLRGNPEGFVKFVEANDLGSQIKSLVVSTKRELSPYRKAVEETLNMRETAKLWNTVFRCVDPGRLVVAAPPSTMAVLTSSRENSMDTWAFEMSMHYVCFSILPNGDHSARATSSETGSPASTRSSVVPSTPTTNSTQIPSSPSSKTPTNVLNIRPWTHLSYNEGTMIAGYAHYEWQWKNPPQILQFILLWLSKETRSSLTRCNLQSFTYTSLFPYSSHVDSIVDMFRYLPSVKVLHVQFSDSDLLGDATRVGKADMDDVWGEWNKCYERIYTSFLRNAKEGTVFTTEDVKNEKLKENICKHIPLQRRMSNGRLHTTFKREDDPEKWIKLKDDDA